MISQKLSEPLHNLIMKSEPALADLHRIPDATPAPPLGHAGRITAEASSRHQGASTRIHVAVRELRDSQ